MDSSTGNLWQPDSCQNSFQAHCELIIIVRFLSNLLQADSNQIIYNSLRSAVCRQWIYFSLFNYNESFLCLTFCNYLIPSNFTARVFPLSPFVRCYVCPFLCCYSPSCVNPQLFECCLQAFLFSILSFWFHHWDGQEVMELPCTATIRKKTHENKGQILV